MRRFLPAVLILVAVAAIYGRTARFSFVGFDDFELVVDNHQVCCGVTAERLRWIWGEAWQKSVYLMRPLTLMSHMLDGAVFGRRPAGHHLVNTVFHAGCALLLLFWLQSLSGGRWRPAAAALLFAVHPVNAEVVAWVAQRSSLLSAFFFLAALWAYQGYRRRPGLRWWLLVFFFFLAAVAAKTSAVVLPLVLLLVDICSSRPRNRARRPARIMAGEKLPFLVVAAGVALLAWRVTYSSAAAVSGATVPLSLRTANALVTPAVYLIKLLVPSGLCVYYPFPQTLGGWQVGGALFLLAAVSGLVIVRRGRAPLALLGWLWYLLTLLPFSGLVQAGPWPGRADHYLYLPLIGLLISLVWSVPESAGQRVGRYPGGRMAVAAGAGGFFLLYGLLAFRQAGFYRNSEVMFQRALAVTRENFLAHTGLGNVRLGQGDLPQAEFHYRRALSLQPSSAGAHANLGLALARSGRPKAARHHYWRALERNPELVEGHVNLANLLVRQGKENRALAHYQAALAVDPDLPEANYNLGRLLLAQGALARAGFYLGRARAVCPENEQYQRAWERWQAMAGEAGSSSRPPGGGGKNRAKGWQQ